ncbi:hypothetical protein Ndes2526A_g08700 [Nannochloris sp. 'desiccata']
MIQRAVSMQMHGLRNSQRSSLRNDSFVTSTGCGKTPSYFNASRVALQKVRSTDDSEPEGNRFLASSTEFIDSLLEKQKKSLKKQEETNESLQLQLEAMRASDAPKLAVSVIEWLVGLNTSLQENEVKRLKELEADRDKFVAEWEEFEQKTENMDPLEIDDLMGQIATGEDASLQATSIVISAFVSATLLSWGSTFFGINVATLLPDPSVPSASDLSTWAMWTLPYVGATAAAGAILGFQWIGNRGTFRFLADDSFFGKLHPTAVLSLSSALAYSQAIAYQGVWLLFFLNLYRGGGNSFSLDPTAADEAAVQQAMGSLIAAPKLMILIAGPAAVVSAAAVEAGYFLIKESINGAVQEVFQNNGTAVLDPENGFRVIKQIESSDAENEKYNVNGITDYKESRIIMGGMMGGSSSPKAPPKVPSLATLEMSAQEFWLTASRVFLASMWMGAETLITGNLWMAAGTGGVGMAVGMAASRQRAREAGLDDD